jgi:hypothetical protein
VSRISTGVQASCATRGTATTSAGTSPSLSPVSSTRPRATGGDSTRIAPVASAESTKPTDEAVAGSRADQTATVMHRADTVDALTPTNRATSTGSAMVAARSTLGSHPTNRM